MNHLMAASSSGGGTFSVFLLLIGLAMIVAVIVGHWRVFAKAGQPGWASLIPILNILVILKIVKRPTWWIILFLIPIVNIVVLIVVEFDLAKAFGKGIGFALGLVLLSEIFLLILGFGSATYQLEPDPIF